MPIELDPVPSRTAGIRTIRCECGWETVFLEPEEDELLVASLFHHLTHDHQLKLPTFISQTH